MVFCACLFFCFVCVCVFSLLFVGWVLVFCPGALFLEGGEPASLHSTSVCDSSVNITPDVESHAQTVNDYFDNR